MVKLPHQVREKVKKNLQQLHFRKLYFTDGMCIVGQNYWGGLGPPNKNIEGAVAPYAPPEFTLLVHGYSWCSRADDG